MGVELAQNGYERGLPAIAVYQSLVRSPDCRLREQARSHWICAGYRL